METTAEYFSMQVAVTLPGVEQKKIIHTCSTKKHLPVTWVNDRSNLEPK